MTTPVLALPGPQYCFKYDGDFQVAGQPIVVHQEGGQGRGTAWAVWDAAAVAARYLEAAAPAIFTGSFGPPPQSVLELGSGTGLAGLAAAAALRLPTVLTDLPDVLPALQRNIAANPGLAGLVTAAPLDWLEPGTSPVISRGGSGGGGGHCDSTLRSGGSGSSCSGVGGRLVLAADCAWLEALVGPFVGALEAAASQQGDRCLLAYQSRSSRVDALLFGQLAAAFEVAPAQLLPGEHPRGPIDLYWLTPRSASSGQA